MRIIGGKFKNKKILLPTDNQTRPLKDIVRESIFNIIEHSNLFENKVLSSSV
ncbi:RsmD family RNA methyltransferase, partial [Candidatus Pelagibacter sp.]|nr:RsmD family RNA methyltransferase [Candidatus Pelagibacter sp.]